MRRGALASREGVRARSRSRSVRFAGGAILPAICVSFSRDLDLRIVFADTSRPRVFWRHFRNPLFSMCNSRRSVSHVQVEIGPFPMCKSDRRLFDVQVGIGPFPMCNSGSGLFDVQVEIQLFRCATSIRGFPSTLSESVLFQCAFSDSAFSMCKSESRFFDVQLRPDRFRCASRGRIRANRQTRGAGSRGRPSVTSRRFGIGPGKPRETSAFCEKPSKVAKTSTA